MAITIKLPHCPFYLITYLGLIVVLMLCGIMYKKKRFRFFSGLLLSHVKNPQRIYKQAQSLELII